MKRLLKGVFGNKQGVYEVLLVLFVVSILIANIVVNRVIELPFGWMTTSAVLIFIIPMWLSDVITEVYGKKKMLKAIYLGFFFNFIMAGFFVLVNMMPSVEGQLEMDSAYQLVLGSSFRILMASGVAYLFGTLMNTNLMLKLKNRKNNKFVIRAFISTVFGQFVDNGLFIILAFAFVLPWKLMLVIVVVETCIEIAVETFILPLTYKMQLKMKSLPDTAGQVCE